MPATRPLLALALSGSLLVAGHAGAATAAPTCNILTDAAGDANDPTGIGVHALPAAVFNDKQQDIVGGDFGTTKTTITGVIKLAGAPALDPFSPQGDIYYVVFTPTGAANPLLLIATSDSSGAMTYAAGDVEPATGGGENYTTKAGVPVKGKVTGSTISMTVTLDALKPLASVKPGRKISTILAKAYGAASVPPPVDTGLLLGGDDSDEYDKTIVVGAPTCVVPVK